MTMATPVRRNLLKASQAAAFAGLDEGDVLADISALEESAPEFPLEDEPKAFGAHAATTLDAATVLSAESSVIGGILRDNSLFDTVVDRLRAEDFIDPAMAAVFRGVADIIEGRVEGLLAADPVSVMTLPGMSRLVQLSRLQRLAETVVDARVLETHVHVVQSAAKERSLGAAVSQAQVILAEDKSLELRSEAILKLLSGASEIRSLPVVSIGNAAVEAINELVALAKDGGTGVGIPTGFFDLDALTAGLHGGQFIVLAARPGVGKTAFALSMALNIAACSIDVLFASMEMKAKELSKRAISILSGVDSHALRIGALSESDWEAAVVATEKLSKLPLDIVDLPSVNLSALTGLCRRLKRAGKLRVLMVDYLQIMETSGIKGASRDQLIGELSRGLKKLAMQLDIPVIALSQLNRAVENRASRRPQLNDLRESGAIEQDADVVMFVHRETIARGGGEDPTQAEIIVEKQRAGSPGEVRLRFVPQTTAFEDESKRSVYDPLSQLGH